MFDLTLDEVNHIAYIEPKSAHTEHDVAFLLGQLKGELKHIPHLNGVLIAAKTFPRYKDFAAFKKHVELVSSMRHKVLKIAFVTDHPIVDLASSLAGAFVGAEVRHFPYSERQAAEDWLLGKEAEPEEKLPEEALRGR